MALEILTYGFLLAAGWSLFVFFMHSKDDSKNPTVLSSETFAKSKQEAWGLFKFNMTLVSIATVAALLFG